ncbi:MAG: cytochrome c biogenesis CcdA family protein [Streptosporangiaceae bacterium]
MSGVFQLVLSGPLLLAMPVAAAAGAVTFLSPCVLPLVPGYLSYVTGMSGSALAGADEPADEAELVPAGAPATAMSPGQADPPAKGASGRPGAAPAARSGQVPGRGRVLAGAALFVLGFSVLFAIYGGAFGTLGRLLDDHKAGLARVLGGILILMGLLFLGAFDRFSIAGRIVRPSMRPRAGLVGAPLLGALFGVGWTPCIGPTLAAVLTLGLSTGTAARGALLAFVYALGLGVPFLLVALGFQRGMGMLGFARRHARLITRIGGVMLIAVGLLEITGVWASAIIWLKVHWLSSYAAPL